MPIIGQISVGDGATFTPSVSSAGELSWTNNKNLPNPATVDIPQVVIDRYQLAPASNPTFTGTVAAEDITASGTITGDLTGTASGNLPLSGGKMAGVIGYSVDNLFLQLNGGTEQTNGAWLRLNGKDNTGNFQIQANDGTNSGALVGRPTGSLTWYGNIVPTKDVNIQTGTANVTVGANTNATVDITFSTPFTATPLVLCTPQTGYAGFFATVTTTSTTGATFRVHNTSSTSRTVNVGWVAISI